MSEKREAALVRRIEAERRRGAAGRRGYTPELRRAVMRHVESCCAAGGSASAVADRLGLQPQTLSRWRHWEDAEREGSLHAITVEEAEPAAVTAVEVVGVPGISLRTLCGIVVDGLTVSDLVTVLRGLR